MQQKDNNDLRAQLQESPQVFQNQVDAQDQQATTAKLARKNIHQKDKAAENLKQFSQSLKNEHASLAIVDIAKSKNLTQNISQQNKNAPVKNSRKQSTSYGKETQQMISKLLSLQQQQINSGQFEKVNITNSLSSFHNIESNQASNRSIKQIRDIQGQKRSSATLNQNQAQIQNDQMQESNKESISLKHLNMPQAQLENNNNNKNQQIQRNQSLNLGNNLDEKNQQSININKKPYLQQSYFRQKTIDNLTFIPQKINFFDKYSQPQDQKQLNILQDRKKSQEIQGLNSEGQIKSIQQIYKPNSVKSITIYGNHLNSTEMSKDFIENSTQQGNTLLINASKNKLLTESQDDQQMFQLIPSSKQTIDSSYLAKFQSVANNNNNSQQPESTQQINQVQGETKNLLDDQLNQNQSIKYRQFLHKSQSSLNYSSNIHESANSAIANKKNQQQSQHTQYSTQHNDNKIGSNFFHSRQSSENLNFKKQGNFYLTGLQSPKSTFNSQSSTRNKPFYHPFSHQNTSSYGEDQSLYNQLFISNLSRYQPFGSHKHSSSQKRSHNNSLKDNNEEDFFNIQSNNYIQGSSKHPHEKNDLSSQFNSKLNTNRAIQKTIRQIEKEIQQKNEVDEDKFEKDLQIQQKQQNQLNSIINKKNSTLLNLRGEDVKSSDQEGKLLQQKKSLSNLLTENLSDMKYTNKKWSQIFRSYKDSKDYLFQSKKGIPKKRKNLLYEYKLVGLSTTPSSLLTQPQQHNQYQFDKNNKSSQMQSKANNQSSFIQVKDIAKKQKQQKLFLSIHQENEQQDKGKSRFSLLQNNKQKSLSPRKSNFISNFQQIQSERNSQKSIGSNKEKDNSEHKLSIIGHLQNQLNCSNLSIKESQTEIQTNYMTFKERMKNQIYPTLETAQQLFEKKLINDEPDVADQKIKLIKYFLDESIPLQEKRNNYKDIQFLYYPENKKHSEKICHEVLPFLNNMKNFFLKYDFYNPLYYLQNISKNDQKLKQPKGYSSNRFSVQLGIDYSQSIIPSLSKYSSRNIQS